MKKRLLLLSLLLAGTSAAQAQSSVTLYGIADAGLQYLSNSTTKSHFSFSPGNYYTSRWGVKGTEDLGGGLSAVFDLENGFDMGTGNFSSAGTEFNRQSWVGLASKQYGTVTMGRQYEAITDLLESYGPISFSGGVGTYTSDVSNYDNDIRVNNSIKYLSPTIGGVTGEVLYGFGNQAGSMNNASTLSAGLNWVNGPLVIAGAYLRMQNGAPSANTWSGNATIVTNGPATQFLSGAKTVQIADALAAYTYGPWRFGLNYGYTQYKPSAVALFTHSIAFNTAGAGVSYQFTPSWIVGLNYSYTMAQSTSADSSSAKPKYQQVAMRTTYSLSKRTSLYAFAGWGHAAGSNVGANGATVRAVAGLGDATNGQYSSGQNETLVRIGMFTKF